MKTWDTKIRGDAVFMLLFGVGVVVAGALGGVFNAINGWVALS